MFDRHVKHFDGTAQLEDFVGYSSSTEVVEAFWNEVWKARNPDKVDDFVVEDFVITSGGERIEGRENFKAWVRDFLGRIDDFRFDVIETFQNQDGSRVASRWRVSGRNNCVPVAPRLIERVVIQREDEPVLQTPRGPLYRLTEHADLGVPTERSSFGVEPETGAVYYVARDGAACFANSTVDLWLQTLHCYGGHVTASELLSEPDDPEEYFSEDEEERALAELSHLARALEEIDPAAFKGYTGFLWPAHLDRWLY